MSGDQKLTKKENAVQIIKFVIFSISAGLIQTIAFTAVNELTDLSYTPCYLTALVLSVLWNFTLNREFTFKSANNIPLAMVKVAAFYCVFTPLSTWWGARLTDAGWNEYIVLFGTMAVNLTTEFLYDRFFVFRGSLNTNKRAKREGKEKTMDKLSKKEKSRLRIMHAAKGLFEKQGLDNVTFSQIAEAADVCRTTVFNHFPERGI